MGDSQPALRIVTTLAPDIPKDYFEILGQYLQTKVGCAIAPIQYSERWRGPQNEKPNPFDTNDADVGFISPAAYIRARAADKKSLELLPVAAVHKHWLSQGKPVYFSEVIMHVKNKDKYDELEKIRGGAWAYSHDHSLSGSLFPRHHLRSYGENSSFFADKRETGSHIATIEMTRQEKCEAGTVSSVVLFIYLNQHPEARNEIFSRYSIGPIPIYPIVVNSKLSGEMKQKLKDAFYSINNDNDMKKKLEPYGVESFQESYPGMYELERDIMNNLRKSNLTVPFY